MLTTTLNIHKDILSKIMYASERLGKTKRDLIVLLLMRIMKNHNLFKHNFSTVKYQPDDDKDKWRCFHIRFREDENEFFSDLRKVSKFSVSFLVAKAVDNYLDKTLQDLEKAVDNYPYFKNYILYHEVVDGIMCWHSYWGMPVEQLKNLRL